MCIAVFSFNPDSLVPLTLGFNRDELYCRESIKPDYYWKGKKILAPKDRQEKGSWLGINSHGLIACIINKDIPTEGGANNIKSRGLLTIDTLSKKSVKEVLDFIPNKDLKIFRPFNLLVIDRYKGVVISNYNNLNKSRLTISEIETGIHLLSKTYIDDLNHPRIKKNFKQCKSIDFNDNSELIHFLNSNNEDLDSSMLQYSDNWGTVSTSIIRLNSNKAYFNYKTYETLNYKDYEIEIKT
jgi:uncharacterized protein with NRDE domain